MLDLLSQRLGNIFKKFGNKGRLTEKDIDEALREVRLALLEADVNLKVVKDFIAHVREQAITTEVMQSLSPMQQIVKIVNGELTSILGAEQQKLNHANQSPTTIMLVGLQGSGKTTTSAKLAVHLKNSGHRCLLIAADTHRPAAIEQLVTLGKQINIPVYQEKLPASPVSITKHGLEYAREIAATWVIVDTAGRLQIDEEMMKELIDIKEQLQPTETLLVVDAMTGQTAVNVADEFNKKVDLTGLILTKLDGDARGGAALSIKSVTGVPVKFVGIGEKSDALEPFHPERMASRILGMGDMLTFIEKAEASFDKDKAAKLQKKMETATFDLEDFMEQLQQMKKMGPLNQIMDMIPGLSKISAKVPEGVDDSQVKRIEAIILSMTPEERHNPQIIDGSRRRRIARGSGRTPQDVNQLLNQFRMTQKMFKQMQSGKKISPMSFFR